MNRQKTVLYVLMGVLLLAVIYAYYQYPHQARVSDSAVAVKSQVRRAVRPKADAAEDNQFRIRFDWLKNEKPFSGAKVDLFGPLQGIKKELPQTPPQGKVPLLPVAAEAGQKRSFAPALDFLGYLSSGKARTFFFVQGEDVFVAKKGAKFGKQKEFRVVGATSKELKIKKQGDTKLLTISLVAKNTVSEFNKHKAENAKEGIPAKRNASSPGVSDLLSEPPPEPGKEVGAKQQSPGVEFHPEGDWEK